MIVSQIILWALIAIVTAFSFLMMAEGLKGPRILARVLLALVVPSLYCVFVYSLPFIPMPQIFGILGEVVFSALYYVCVLAVPVWFVYSIIGWLNWSLGLFGVSESKNG